jgi:hypothetical protein
MDLALGVLKRAVFDGDVDAVCLLVESGADISSRPVMVDVIGMVLLVSSSIEGASQSLQRGLQ